MIRTFDSITPINPLAVHRHTVQVNLQSLDFNLPPQLEASVPPEARGLARDEVRLMVSHYRTDEMIHTQFRALTDFLEPGDVLAINTSKTLKAALKAIRQDGTPLELHLSTRLPDGHYTIELRTPQGQSTSPFLEAQVGEVIRLPLGASATLLAPYHRAGVISAKATHARLWVAELDLPCPLFAYLDTFGFPIRYSYVPRSWPIEYYQTVFATEPGSAEMPSAGRAFTPELITRLVSNGIQFAPLLLHTGVASQEANEPPYEEYYRVPADTARTINTARDAGKRIIAVGTTVVRALESVSDAEGRVRSGTGWTDLVITPRRGMYAVDGLLSGFHEPQATHLAMLEALAGRDHLLVAYQAALEQRYLWHEFGDLHLILP